MIMGVGTDLIALDRIEPLLRHPKFLLRVLTPAERRVRLSAAYVAGRWAAKEAIAKAVSTTLGWHDVEILAGDSGRPVARVAGLPASDRVWVSISHDRTHAVAVAIWERPSGTPLGDSGVERGETL